MKTKTLLTVLLSLIFVVVLTADESDFFIGTYSHYDWLDDAWAGWPGPTGSVHQYDEENAEAIAAFMKNANFNHVNEVDIYKEKFIEQGLTPIVSDMIAKYSYYNDCDYQAEFITDGLPDPNILWPTNWSEEMKWYKITTEVDLNSSNHVDHVLESNGFPTNFIILNQNNTEPGIVYDEYVKPYSNEISRTQLYNWFGGGHGLDYYILSFKVRVDPDSLSQYPSPSTEICKIGAKLLCENGDSPVYEYVDLTPFPGDENNYTGDGDFLCIDKQDLMNIFDPENTDQDFVYFRFKVTQDTIESHNMYTRHHSTNVCPVIYYSGNGPLDIDYVNISDDKMELLKDDNSWISENVREAAQEYGGMGLKEFSGRDEPQPANYRAHKRMKEILEEYGANIYQSAGNDIWDAFDHYNEETGNHLNNKVFLELGKTNQIMPQFYPSTTGKKWNIVENPENPYTDNNSRHHQNWLTIMTDTYREQKEECLRKEHNPNFYPIVQSYGKIDVDDNRWKALLPPCNTQKVLSYLPLCYGADGIFYYVFENMGCPEEPLESNKKDEEDTEKAIHEEEPIVERGNAFFQRALVNKYSATDEWDITPQYNAVKEANAQILTLGKIIRDLEWDSDKTFTIMPEYSNFFSLFNSEISSVSMKAYDPTGLNTPALVYQEGYDGFVECSVYNDGISDYFMFVNRRSNFPKDQYVRPSGYIDAEGLPQNNSMEDAFAIAQPQLIEFNYSNPLSDGYVLRDLYTGETYSAEEVEIEAGEALLLRLEKDVPEVMTESMTINNLVLYHSVTIPSGITLDLSGNIRLLEDVNIIVEAGGTLILADNIDLKNNAKIICNENGKIVVSDNAVIKGENENSEGNGNIVKVYGNISIGNQVSFTANSGKKWDGLDLYESTSLLNLNNSTFNSCNLTSDSRNIVVNNSNFTNGKISQKNANFSIENSYLDNSPIECKVTDLFAQDFGIELFNNEIKNCEEEAIYLDSYGKINIVNNIIRDNDNYGLYLKYCGHRRIDNEIENNIIKNNESIGISLYHCDDINIIGSNAVQNNAVGLYARNSSTWSSVGNENHPIQSYRNNQFYEVVFDYDSKPDRFYFNQVFELNNYCHVICYNVPTGLVTPVHIENNYFDDNFNPEADLSPVEIFEYLPYWDPGDPRENDLSEAKTLYQTAKESEKNQDYSTADGKYKELISAYPETVYAENALKSLLALESKSNKDYLNLQSYYLNNSVINNHENLLKIAQNSANFCSVRAGNYPEAIEYYENVIDSPPTLADSVYAVLDAGYAYLLMEEEGGRAAEYVGKKRELKPRSFKAYRNTERELLGKLFGNNEAENQDDIPKFAKLNQNYPNPFSVSDAARGIGTNISFSIPEPGKVSIAVFNIKGQKVKNITNKEYLEGNYTVRWSGKDETGKTVGTGVYFYKLNVNGKTKDVNKCLLIK